MKNKNKLSLVGVERGVSVKMAVRIKTSRDFMKSSSVALVIFLALAISTRASKADNLKIGYGAFSLGYALIWITKEGRLFDKNGLDVDVLYL